MDKLKLWRSLGCAPFLQHEYADRRGQVGAIAIGVDTGDKARKGYALSRRYFAQRVPKRVFK